MAKRSRDLIKQSQATRQSAQATLQRTAPKATLGGIRQAAEKRFGQRKQHKPVQQNQPKQVKPKKQHKPKSVSSRPLENWEKAMRKANIPAHRWRKIKDKISRLSGADRIKIEKELFDHAMFDAVYEAGDEKGNEYLVDEYLSDLEEKLDELKNDNIDVVNMIEDANEFLQKNPTLGLVAVKYVVGGNNMEFKVHEVDNGVVFEDETGRLLAGFNSAELDSVEMSLLEDLYTIIDNGDSNNWTDFEPLSPEEFAKLLEETKRNRLD